MTRPPARRHGRTLRTQPGKPYRRQSRLSRPSGPSSAKPVRLCNSARREAACPSNSVANSNARDATPRRCRDNASAMSAGRRRASRRQCVTDFTVTARGSRLRIKRPRPGYSHCSHGAINRTTRSANVFPTISGVVLQRRGGQICFRAPIVAGSEPFQSASCFGFGSALAVAGIMLRRRPALVMRESVV